jgi:cyanate permease
MRAPLSAAAAGRSNLGNACQKISSPAARRARSELKQAVLGQACLGLLGCLGVALEPGSGSTLWQLMHIFSTHPEL